MFVPRRTFECDKFIQDNNLIDVNDFKNEQNKSKVEARITQLNIELLPIEKDVLSLELPNSFMHHALDCDDTYKIYTQFAIHKLEAVYGKIPFKCAIGAQSN